VYDKRNEPRKALAAYLHVLDSKRKTLGPTDPSTVQYLTITAIRYANLAEYTHARPLFEEAVAARRAALGDSDPITLTAVNSLATCLSNLKLHAKALPMFIDVLARRRGQVGNRPLEEVEREVSTALLTTCTNLALCYDTMGEHGKAEAFYVEAWEGRKTVLGEAHPSTLSALQNVAIYYRNEGETDLAEEHYLELLEQRKNVCGVSGGVGTRRCFRSRFVSFRFVSFRFVSFHSWPLALIPHSLLLHVRSVSNTILP
jgi:tetratricopeptide (TPR) repeat protein